MSKRTSQVMNEAHHEQQKKTARCSSNQAEHGFDWLNGSNIKPHVLILEAWEHPMEFVKDCT